MHLKNILSICLLFAGFCLADNTKTDKPQTPGNDAGADNAAKVENVIKPEATPEDLKAADCSKISAPMLNKLTNMKACAGLTAGCLAKFDATGVCAECLSNVPMSEWKQFEAKTVNQISRSAPEALSMNPQQLEVIIPKLDLSNLADGLAGYVVRTPALLEVIFESGNGKILAAFINAKTLPSMPINNFSRFGSKFIANLKEDAFTGIQADQIAVIPADAFAGFYAKQWAVVSAAALTGVSRQQAGKLSVECWDATTIEQIKNFGQPVNKFNAMGMQKANVLDRRQFKDQHPCNAFENVKKDMEEKKAKAFEERCKEVTAFKINDAAALKSSAVTIGLMLAVVALPALLI